jgi:RHS repeat-associated protein
MIVTERKVVPNAPSWAGSAYSAEHNGIALQASGDKIVTAGWTNACGDDFFIARYNVSNLALDTSFDGDGMLSTTFGSGTGDVAYGVAIQPDGRIIAAGSTTTPGSGGATEFAVARMMGGPVLEQRLYALHDANYNVTGIVDAEDGDVVERYIETPYGTVTVLNGADDKDPSVQEWSPDAQGPSDWGWDRVHQGLPADPESGLVYNRWRYLHTSLGRTLQRDSKGYVDGMNIYQTYRSSPTDHVDPAGLRTHLRPFAGSVYNKSNVRVTVSGDYVEIYYRTKKGAIKEIHHPVTELERLKLYWWVNFDVFDWDTWVDEKDFTTTVEVPPGGDTRKMRDEGETLMVDADFVNPPPGYTFVDDNGKAVAMMKWGLKLSGGGRATVANSPYGAKLLCIVVIW